MRGCPAARRRLLNGGWLDDSNATLFCPSQTGRAIGSGPFFLPSRIREAHVIGSRRSFAVFILPPSAGKTSDLRLL
jgi:hypothetical protein